MDVQFVASFSPIVADPSAARAFYQQALGLSFEGKADDYMFTEMLGGVKHFGLWPLTEAAQAASSSSCPARRRRRRRPPSWPVRVIDSSMTLAPSRGGRSSPDFSAPRAWSWACAIPLGSTKEPARPRDEATGAGEPRPDQRHHRAHPAELWLSSGQSWRTRRATPRPDLISCLGDLYGRPRWQPERGPRRSRPAAAGEPVISRV